MIAQAVSQSRCSPNLEERDELVMSQLPEVRFIARRIHRRLPPFVPLEDLVHSGVLGLLEARQKYDPTTNVRFKTFAQFRIRGAILDSLRELDRASRRMRVKSGKLDAASEKLAQRLGRRATEEEIAQELGLDLAALRKIAITLRSLESADRQSTSGKDRTESVDLVESAPAKSDENPFTQCLRSEMRRSLALGMSTLTSKEQEVVSLYYFEQLTMQEIASALSVKKSRVSQIHSAAIAKLRAHLQIKENNKPDSSQVPKLN